jgi:hypothetical protein
VNAKEELSIGVERILAAQRRPHASVSWESSLALDKRGNGFSKLDAGALIVVETRPTKPKLNIVLEDLMTEPKLNQRHAVLQKEQLQCATWDLQAGA